MIVAVLVMLFLWMLFTVLIMQSYRAYVCQQVEVLYHVHLNIQYP